MEELRALSLFDGLDDATLEQITRFCRPRPCAEGDELLLQQDERGRDLYLLLGGTVDLVARPPDGARSREVQLDNLDYELLGEISWLLHGGRSATLICNRDTRLVQVDGPALLTYLETRPEVGFPVLKRMMMVMAKKLQDSNLLLL